LQDALIPGKPIVFADNLNVYAGREINAFDIDKLIYFGMSLFWRGAAREWKTSTGAVAPAVDLGEHFEPIREFLLGGKFPDDIFLVIAIGNQKPPGNAALPVLRGTAQYGDFYCSTSTGSVSCCIWETEPRLRSGLCVRITIPKAPSLSTRVSMTW
jgi:hypothetical protein